RGGRYRRLRTDRRRGGGARTRCSRWAVSSSLVASGGEAGVARDDPHPFFVDGEGARGELERFALGATGGEDDRLARGDGGHRRGFARGHVADHDLVLGRGGGPECDGQSTAGLVLDREACERGAP